MAVAAETAYGLHDEYVFAEQSAELFAVEDYVGLARRRRGAGFTLRQAGVWISADDIPDLHQAREAADVEADAVYEGYMVHVREGEVESVPLAGDAVSAAKRLLVVERQFGKHSAEYQEGRKGVRTGNERYLAETWSKLGPEHFAPLKQTYDATKRDYIAFGEAVTPMIHRGITPLAEAEEVPRRYMENRENATNNRVGELIMRVAGVKLVDASVPAVALPSELRRRHVSSQTISQCPDHIIERYERDDAAGRKRSYGGYAPQIKKIMLRDTSFDPKTGDRYVEQLSVSGEYITHEVVMIYMERKKVVPEGTKLSKTDVLGLQVLTSSTEGVMGMGRDLDNIASMVSGKNIFLGEEVPTDHPKDYGAFPAEAAARQEKQQADAETLTEFTLRLAAEDIPTEVANALYDKIVMDLMFEEAKRNNTMAKVAFGEETAGKLRRLDQAYVNGDHRLAQDIEEEARASAPPPEGCSGGGCEVRIVDPKSAEGIALAKATNARPGDTLAVDESKNKKRRCRKCNSQLGYASQITGKVHSVCLGKECGAFVSKDPSKK